MPRAFSSTIFARFLLVHNLAVCKYMPFIKIFALLKFHMFPYVSRETYSNIATIVAVCSSIVVMVIVVDSLCVCRRNRKKAARAALSAIIAQARREITFVAAPRDAPSPASRIARRAASGIREIACSLRDTEARNDEGGKFGLGRNADPRGAEARSATMNDIAKGDNDNDARRWAHESAAATRIPE